MKIAMASLLSVLRAAMRLLTDMSPDVRTKCGSAVIPPIFADDDSPPDVVGVTKGTFEWT